MRPIDANALKEDLKNPPLHLSLGGMSMRDVLQLIDYAPTIDVEPKWIPCKEKLPKVGEEVLCQCRANIIEVLCLNERGFWENPSSFRHYFNSFVIAWMPLPRPYVEKKIR